MPVIPHPSSDVTPAHDELGDLRRLNWALGAYARCTSILIHTKNLDELVTKVCEAIVGQEAYRIAAVGLAEHDDTKSVRIFSSAGPASAYFEDIPLSWSEDQPEGRGPAGIAIRTGKPFVANDCLNSEIFAPWRDRAARFGIGSTLTMPFRWGEAAMGVLNVYAGRLNAFGADELALFERLAEEVGYAMSLDAERLRLAEAETARSVAEQALRESEARYRSLFDNAPDGIILIADEGPYLDINPSACEMLGYRREDFIGLRGPDLVGEDQMPLLAKTVETIAARGVYRGAWRLKRRDGSWVPTEAVTTQMPDKSYVSIIRDMTEQERAEAARQAAEEVLRNTQAKLARAGRAAMLGEVMVTISHEINQPLAAIATNSDAAQRWLGHDPPNLDEVRESLNHVVRDSRRASQVIRRTRDFLGGKSLERAAFDLNAALEEVMSLSRTEQRRAAVVMRLSLDPDLPRVDADRTQIQQVALNVALNALDAMAAQEDTVRLLTIATSRLDPDCALVEVADTGPGLDPEIADKLFNQFFTTKVQGTGVGLAISHSIIEAHGGRIWAENGPAGGAVFRFTVPLAADAAS